MIGPKQTVTTRQKLGCVGELAKFLKNDVDDEWAVQNTLKLYSSITLLDLETCATQATRAHGPAQLA